MSIKTSILDKYLALEAEFKAIEMERTAMRAAIVQEFQKEGIEKFEDPRLGSFTVAHRTTYEFSKAVKALEEKVKIAKTKEQQKGTAKVKSETSYLVYTEPKSE